MHIRSPPKPLHSLFLWIFSAGENSFLLHLCECALACPNGGIRALNPPLRYRGSYWVYVSLSGEQQATSHHSSSAWSLSSTVQGSWSHFPLTLVPSCRSIILLYTESTAEPKGGVTESFSVPSVLTCIFGVFAGRVWCAFVLIPEFQLLKKLIWVVRGWG